jgi:hypothetical protein
MPKKRLTAVVTLVSISLWDLPASSANKFGLPAESSGGVTGPADELAGGMGMLSLGDAGSEEELAGGSGALPLDTGSLVGTGSVEELGAGALLLGDTVPGDTGAGVETGAGLELEAGAVTLPPADALMVDEAEAVTEATGKGAS